MFEVFGEIDTIVSGTRLFTKCDNLIVAPTIEFDKPFAESVPDHAVADHHDRLLIADHGWSRLRRMGQRWLVRRSRRGRAVRYEPESGLRTRGRGVGEKLCKPGSSHSTGH